MEGLEYIEIVGAAGFYALPFQASIGSKLARLPLDFNPDFQDVIIVNKKARRIWIEQSGGDVAYLHQCQPSWGSGQWNPNGNTSRCASVMSLPDGDCVEFVAVATHRPPEPEKPQPTPRQTWEAAAARLPINADYFSAFVVDTRDA